jgi:hypothetical protein
MVTSEEYQSYFRENTLEEHQTITEYRSGHTVSIVKDHSGNGKVRSPAPGERGTNITSTDSRRPPGTNVSLQGLRENEHQE